MGEPGQFDHLPLVYHFTVPLKVYYSTNCGLSIKITFADQS